MKTTILEILGVSCLALFAFAVWPPACLLVMGTAALLASWAAHGSPTPHRGGRS